MRGRVPFEYWTYLKVINSPLYQAACNSTATEVGMRHDYGIFQAEKIEQYTLELGLRG